MKNGIEDKIILLESWFSTSEELVKFASTGNAQIVNPDILAYKKLETVQNLCNTIGDVANIAQSIISMVKDIQRIKLESTVIISELEGKIHINLARIQAIAITLDTIRQIVLSMPNDYSDRYLMEKKAEFIQRMSELSMKIVDLT